ncbi:MAG: HU family DNA-binding protein [Alphaproteobacteria bacterium]
MATKPTTPKAQKKPLANPRAVAAKVVKPVVADPSPVAGGVAARDVASDLSGNPKAAATAQMRLKDLVDHVTKASGFKKKDVKVVVEATLARIGAALQNGDSMALAGLGKLRMVRAASGPGGVMTLKLRMATPGAKPASAASVPADDQDDD